jgi:MOSC domain-containing protein YiiM
MRPHVRLRPIRLVSINVARPRTVRWRGQDVRTSIHKEPVEGRWMARRLNLDGDGQADLMAHGGEHRAVYVYQRESYRHWERELGRSFDGFRALRRELHRRRPGRVLLGAKTGRRPRPLTRIRRGFCDERAACQGSEEACGV